MQTDKARTSHVATGEQVCQVCFISSAVEVPCKFSDIPIDQKLVACEGCGLNTHLQCYGLYSDWERAVVQKKRFEWTCDSCRQQGTISHCHSADIHQKGTETAGKCSDTKRECFLCSNPGLLKRVESIQEKPGASGMFAHPICLLFNPRTVTFSFKNLSFGWLDDFLEANSEIENKNCQNVCLQCGNSRNLEGCFADCQNYCHFYCAWKSLQNGRQKWNHNLVLFELDYQKLHQNKLDSLFRSLNEFPGYIDTPIKLQKKSSKSEETTHRYEFSCPQHLDCVFECCLLEKYQNVDNIEFLQCEQCIRWYHKGCVSKKDRPKDQLSDSFICSPCKYFIEHFQESVRDGKYPYKGREPRINICDAIMLHSLMEERAYQNLQKPFKSMLSRIPFCPSLTFYDIKMQEKIQLNIKKSLKHKSLVRALESFKKHQHPHGTEIEPFVGEVQEFSAFLAFKLKKISIWNLITLKQRPIHCHRDPIQLLEEIQSNLNELLGSKKMKRDQKEQIGQFIIFCQKLKYKNSEPSELSGVIEKQKDLRNQTINASKSLEHYVGKKRTCKVKQNSTSSEINANQFKENFQKEPSEYEMKRILASFTKQLRSYSDLPLKEFFRQQKCPEFSTKLIIDKEISKMPAKQKYAMFRFDFLLRQLQQEKFWGKQSSVRIEMLSKKVLQKYLAGSVTLKKQFGFRFHSLIQKNELSFSVFKKTLKANAAALQQANNSSKYLYFDKEIQEKIFKSEFIEKLSNKIRMLQLNSKNSDRIECGLQKLLKTRISSESQQSCAEQELNSSKNNILVTVEKFKTDGEKIKEKMFEDWIDLYERVKSQLIHSGRQQTLNSINGGGKIDSNQGLTLHQELILTASQQQNLVNEQNIESYCNFLKDVNIICTRNSKQYYLGRKFQIHPIIEQALTEIGNKCKAFIQNHREVIFQRNESIFVAARRFLLLRSDRDPKFNQITECFQEIQCLRCRMIEKMPLDFDCPLEIFEFESDLSQLERACAKYQVSAYKQKIQLMRHWLSVYRLTLEHVRQSYLFPQLTVSDAESKSTVKISFNQLKVIASLMKELKFPNCKVLQSVFALYRESAQIDKSLSDLFQVQSRCLDSSALFDQRCSLEADEVKGQADNEQIFSVEMFEEVYKSVRRMEIQEIHTLQKKIQESQFVTFGFEKVEIQQIIGQSREILTKFKKHRLKDKLDKLRYCRRLAQDLIKSPVNYEDIDTIVDVMKTWQLGSDQGQFDKGKSKPIQILNSEPASKGSSENTNRGSEGSLSENANKTPGKSLQENENKGPQVVSSSENANKDPSAYSVDTLGIKVHELERILEDLQAVMNSDIETQSNVWDENLMLLVQEITSHLASLEKNKIRGSLLQKSQRIMGEARICLDYVSNMVRQLHELTQKGKLQKSFGKREFDEVEDLLTRYSKQPLISGELLDMKTMIDDYRRVISCIPGPSTNFKYVARTNLNIIREFPPYLMTEEILQIEDQLKRVLQL